MTTKPTSQKAYDIRLILVRASDLDWLKGDRLKDIQAQARAGHKWIPAQQLPYNETILYAYAADRTNRPTYVCLPSGLYNARAGRVLAQSGPDQEITPLYRAFTSLMGGEYIQHWLSPPTYQAQKRHQYVGLKPPHTALPAQNRPRSPEEEARDILATAAKNQTEDGPIFFSVQRLHGFRQVVTHIQSRQTVEL